MAAGVSGMLVGATGFSGSEVGVGAGEVDVDTAVCVAVDTGVCVAVGSGVFVGIRSGVSVGRGVGVLVGVSSGIAVKVGVGVGTKLESNTKSDEIALFVSGPCSTVTRTREVVVELKVSSAFRQVICFADPATILPDL